MAAVAENLAAVRDGIAAACHRAGRAPDAVRLIAVTKEQPPAALADLISAGVLDFGENRVDHARTMRAAAPAQARLHFIGRLQSRQLTEVAALSACVHGLCDADHAAKLDRLCAAAGKRLEVFVQVNVSGEATKAGIAPEALPALLERVRAAERLDLVGLMTMAPPPEAADAAAIRACFAGLRALAERHRLPRLSMGMSSDFTVAIEEGATDVRVGTRLFA